MPATYHRVNVIGAVTARAVDHLIRERREFDVSRVRGGVIQLALFRQSLTPARLHRIPLERLNVGGGARG